MQGAGRIVCCIRWRIRDKERIQGCGQGFSLSNWSDISSGEKEWGGNKSHVLEMLGLSLLNIQVEMSRKQLEIGVWSSGEEVWVGAINLHIDGT